ncbi:MAG: flagellar motor stator protein MotA [Pirellulales bacterium]|nr:flagellar motor stator protein MotA [Pirellulales bacterium]
MVVVIGCVVVLGAVLGGFTMAGGKVGALIHPSEFVTIGGAALGALILMSPKKVLVDLVKGMVQSLKGSPYDKRGYEELLQFSYELLKTARRDGTIAVESHISNPHQSSIFGKYPRIEKNHHVMDFLCRALSPVIDGTVTAEQLPKLLEAELHVLEEEHHAPLGVLSKTADALPGFGIVAAVLGIVITMMHIDGPVEEIGEKVGAALVGTFLGILMSYGFLGPMAVRMEFLGTAELSYFRALAGVAEAMATGVAPKVAVEGACRRMSSEVRPNREELDQIYAKVDAS